MKEIFVSGSSTGAIAIVDDEDFDKLSSKKWRIKVTKTEKIYAVETVRPHRFMHWLILPKKPDLQVDHINNNGLDNRKCNLRYATNSQNSMNRSKYKNRTSVYKGVHWNNKLSKWIAKITTNRRTTHLGTFNNEVDAAIAYDVAARNLFGEFAKLNFREAQ